LNYQLSQLLFQPIREIAEITRQRNILFHSDAAQSVGKITVDVAEMDVDLLSVAGHKLYAPKGIGVLYIRRGVRLEKLMHGADHEANRRAGTENVLEIVGLGKAAEIIDNSKLKIQNNGANIRSQDHKVISSPVGRLALLRDHLYNGIVKEIPEVRLNGHPQERLPNTLSLGFPGVEANTLLQAMPEIAASAGAACHSGGGGMSGVLAAMQIPSEFAIGTIRFSVGRMTTEEEIDRAIPVIVKAYGTIQNSKLIIQRERDVTETLSHKVTKSPVTNHESPVTYSLPSPLNQFRLTDYTTAPGCACKIKPQVLEEVLRKLPAGTDPRVLVGPETSDDAAIYKLNDRQALIQTVDVIPPVVDDPYAFGMIAAANALSDVYAMGGKPLYALNIIGFPGLKLPVEVLEQILQGAAAKTKEAGVEIVGGHSIDIAEPFFGLSVTGMVDPSCVLRNRGLNAGDSLVLTKPLGSGILAKALKEGLLGADHKEGMINSLVSLNRDAADTMTMFDVHACTDITGFGLLGHLKEMIGVDPVDVAIEVGKVPLMAGVWEILAEGLIPGGCIDNLDFVGKQLSFEEGVSDMEKLIVSDPQTSGGLLIGIPENLASGLVEKLRSSGIQDACAIGKVRSGNGKIIVKR